MVRKVDKLIIVVPGPEYRAPCEYLGGIAGCLEMMDSVTGCTADVEIISENGGHAIGGLCGYSGTHSIGDIALATEGVEVHEYPALIQDCHVTVKMNIPGATHVGGLAVYKTLVRHGMEKEAATDVVRQFFVKICGIMFKPVSWYQHIGGNYHRYPAGMVKNSLRDFSPDAGFEYRMPEKVNPAVARFDIVSCPYYAMCRKYHCIELNPAFCDSDDAKYGNLHKNLKWARTGTIGKGASCCDFRIIDISRCPDYKD